MYPNYQPESPTSTIGTNSPISPRSRSTSVASVSPPQTWNMLGDEIPDLPLQPAEESTQLVEGVPAEESTQLVEGVPVAAWQRLGDLATGTHNPHEEETFLQLYYYRTNNPGNRGDEKIADVLFIFKPSVALRVGMNPRILHHMTGNDAIGLCLSTMQCAYDTGVYAALASSNSIDCTPATFLRYCVQIYTESNIVPGGIWFVADM